MKLFVFQKGATSYGFQIGPIWVYWPYWEYLKLGCLPSIGIITKEPKE